ncbi:MAG: DUF4202 domain-containing protein [Microthrixaceae bacterium]
MSVDGRFEEAIEAIDARNAADPVTITVAGEARPKELAHAEMMTAWVQRLDPDATPEQLIAARAHHLRRWSIPRDTYPEGRAGYLRWRTALRKQHAAEVASLLAEVGYDAAAVERVRAIVNKEGLGSDPAVQVHEDALCLVFLETQLADTAERLGDDKIVDVIRKTAAKMSQRALELAGELPMRPADRALVQRALTDGS